MCQGSPKLAPLAMVKQKKVRPLDQPLANEGMEENHGLRKYKPNTNLGGYEEETSVAVLRITVTRSMRKGTKHDK